VFGKVWRIIRAVFALTIASGAMANGWAQQVTVIEYYNKTLDSYFITGRANEQQALDGIADFQRTGMSFQAVSAGAVASAGSTRVCRFYINSSSPYANTHFYGRENVDCESIRAQNLSGFTWEGYDFALPSASDGVCPSGAIAIYRSFRAAAGGKTANHRYSTSVNSYNAATSVGYAPEQAAFCATAATDVTVQTAASCGTLYYPNVRISYRSTNDRGATNSWTRLMSGSTVTFNAQTAQPVIEQYASGESVTLMIDQRADSWTDLGVSTQTATGKTESYYLPSTVQPRQMTAGQAVYVDRYVAFNPTQSFGSPRQTGNITFIGNELITVAAGTYSACKFNSQISSQYDAIGRSEVNKTTLWVVPGVGMVMSKIENTITDDFGPSSSSINTDVRAELVERL
jgi:hypothetical protein